ncbi:MAG: hypothetical protein WAW85_07680 [Gordonia sp. (in: high G+C Gram-positive bacteria)]|uniref:hypothetical protein n=1 Tax=Gordonia sp. (in: high G+C Gram-positive bacteria) TaxID=84139 RepID=UPI003BB57783
MGVGRQAWQKGRRRPGGDDPAAAVAQEVLNGVPLVPPWTVDEFSAWISERYDRSVDLQPWGDDDPGVEEHGRCGLLIVTADRFLISFDGARSPRHQRQQIFHEFGHILCGHIDDHGVYVGALPTTSSLTDGIDPAMVQHVLHRGVFDTEEERAAELLGTHLAVLSRQERGTGRFDRIASAFFEPVKK